ncbi:TPA: restriction endonuclease, partial [Pseudomonas aeruginosa]|nr:restriction endonuclease [Pseudomonas aeruginosa]
QKSSIADSLDAGLYQRGWEEKQFKTSIIVDEQTRHTPTHKVDCYKNRIAIEIEWNNKDPFYDRDLNNFRLLFERDAISVGVIITRSSELQEIFNEIGKGKSYGPSTTHWRKLIPRIHGGGSGGCPVIAFGITKGLYIED